MVAVYHLRDRKGGKILEIFDNGMDDGLIFDMWDREGFEAVVELLKAAAKWFNR